MEPDICLATGSHGVQDEVATIVSIIVADVVHLVAPTTVALPVLRTHPHGSMDAEELAESGQHTASTELVVNAALIVCDGVRVHIAFVLVEHVAPRSSPTCRCQ